MDATCVLNWLVSEKNHSASFIKNRVRDCKTIISDYQVQLHHVGGKENPADFLTKSFSIKFDSCSLWLNGPQFLIDGVNGQFLKRHLRGKMKNMPLFLKFMLALYC